MTADQPTLRSEIETDVVASIPPSIQAMIDRMVDDLQRRDATPGIAVGEVAPGFKAPTRGETS